MKKLQDTLSTVTDSTMSFISHLKLPGIKLRFFFLFMGVPLNILNIFNLPSNYILKISSRPLFTVKKIKFDEKFLSI